MEQIEALLKMITMSKNRKIFYFLSAKMVGKINDCLAPFKKVNKSSFIANISKAVVKLSTSFHEERIGALQSSWNSLQIIEKVITANRA